MESAAVDPPLYGLAAGDELDGQWPGMRRILTVHTPMTPRLMDAVLTAVQGALETHGVSRMTAAGEGRDIVVLAELPNER